MTKFVMSDVVVSTVKIDDVEPFSYFTIKGQGDLSYNACTDKKGYGFNLVKEVSTKDKNDNWIMNTRNFYFTNDEMQNNFIMGYEYHKNETQIKRDIKINKIINEEGSTRLY